jgi:hypothetical protein
MTHVHVWLPLVHNTMYSSQDNLLKIQRRILETSFENITKVLLPCDLFALSNS